jgi:hypothetical protein
MVSLIDPAVDLNQKEKDPYGRKIDQQKTSEHPDVPQPSP